MAHKVALWQALRGIPENRDVSRADALRPVALSIVAELPLVRRPGRVRRASVFQSDLRRLNDVLAASPLSGRYWLWSGILLGWAREGRLLTHDLYDADFAYAEADSDRLEATVPLLAAAGFRPWFGFRNNDGTLTQRVFSRHGAKFEFFRMTDEPDHTRRYFVYGIDGDGLVQITKSIPGQELEPFEFLGREWLKPRDHDSELTAVYGEWRIPDPGWDYITEGPCVDRRAWRPGLQAPERRTVPESGDPS